MSCKVNRVELCHLKPESWKDKIISFDRDVSSDSFDFEIKSLSDGVKKNIKPTVISSEKIAIKDPELKVGRYFMRLIWIRGDERIIVFEGGLQVLSQGSTDGACGGGECEYSFVIEDCEEVVSVAIEERNLIIQGATIQIGGIHMIGADEPARVENIGTDENVILMFYIPEGQGGGVTEEWLNDLAERVTDAEISFETFSEVIFQNLIYLSEELYYLDTQLKNKADKSEAYSNSKVEAYLKSLDGFGDGKTLTVENGNIKWI